MYTVHYSTKYFKNQCIKSKFLFEILGHFHLDTDIKKKEDVDGTGDIGAEGTTKSSTDTGTTKKEDVGGIDKAGVDEALKTGTDATDNIDKDEMGKADTGTTKMLQISTVIFDLIRVVALDKSGESA